MKKNKHSQAILLLTLFCAATFAQMPIDTNNAEAYYSRGIEYGKKGDYDSAISDLTEAMRLKPNQPKDLALAYNARGNSYYKKKDYDRAIADYNEAMRLNPNLMKENYIRDGAIRREQNFFAEAYNARGYAYAKKKDYDRAIADYTEAIRQIPDVSLFNEGGAFYNEFVRPLLFTVVYGNRGYTYYMKKDYDSAKADFESLLQIDSDNPDAKKYLEIIKGENE